MPWPVEALRPYATGGSFLNFPADRARTAMACTAANHRRLREVRRTYDPAGFSHFNRDIPPAHR